MILFFGILLMQNIYGINCQAVKTVIGDAPVDTVIEQSTVNYKFLQINE